MKPFRNKTFSSLRYQRKIQKLLSTEGIELNFFKKEEGPESLYGFYAFFCAWKHNENELFFPMRSGEGLLEKKIIFFPDDEIEIKTEGFEGTFTFPKDWKETISSSKFSWKLDRSFRLHIRLKTWGLERKLLWELKEADCYQQAMEALSLNLRMWLLEQKREGVEGFYLISERLRLLGINLSAEYLHENVDEVCLTLSTTPLSCGEIVDATEIYRLNKDLRSRCYNYELLTKIKQESTQEKVLWQERFHRWKK